MQITIFSVWMTFVWCNIFIVLCYILRKRSVLLNLSSMTGIIILYLFCLIRLAVPVELPWTKVVSGGSLYNCIWRILTAGFAEQNGRNAKLNGRITFDY